MSEHGAGGQPPIRSWSDHQPGSTSVCPRHPDRAAYVRCQRCHRPACPECQRPAPVGVQCVDCVREAAKSAPVDRTIFGGVATTGTPVVTYTLIGICVAMFGLQLAKPSITDDLAFAPIVGWVEPWRFVTAAFLHSPQMYAHILFNMYALWVLGTYLEPMLGRARFVALYLISAIGGQVAVVLLAGSPTVEGLSSGRDIAWQTGVVGASGAIFGLFGALLILNRHLGRSSAQMYVVLGINALFGFLYPGISWQAHLGGFLTGLAVAGVIVAMRGRDVRRYVWPALGAVLTILVLIVVAKYLTLPEIIRTAGRSAGIT